MPRATTPGGATAAALALLAILGAGAWAAEPVPLPVREIAPGVYVHEGVQAEATAENLGGIANVGFVVGAAAVAVIDTGGSAAFGERLRAAVRAVSELPFRYVINTHVHPDHVFGNAAFVADAPVFVGHARLPGALAARGAYYLDALPERLGAAAGTRVVAPTLTVADRLEIDLGGRLLRLTAHPTAHTDNDLTVHDAATGTLWLGDLLFRERIPVIDGSLKGWLEVTEELRRTAAARVVPGHGPVTADWPGALDPQERYLRALLDEIRAALAAGGRMEAAVETVGRAERGNWLLFDDYHARNVVTAFAELEWE